MLSREKLMTFAMLELNGGAVNDTQPPKIVVTRVDERENSWVVFFESREYIEDKNEMKQLIGNGPLVVHKTIDKFAATATFPDFEDRILEAEEWIESDGKTGGRSVVHHGPISQHLPL